MNNLIKKIMEDYDIPSFHICNCIMEIKGLNTNLNEEEIEAVGNLAQKITNHIETAASKIVEIEGLDNDALIAIKNTIYGSKNICKYFATTKLEVIEEHYNKVKESCNGQATTKFFSKIDSNFNLENAKKHSPWA